MTTAVEAAGLSDAEVAERVAEGKTNDVPARAARSVKEIVRANVFTRINAILGVLLIIVLATGSFINGLFGLLIVANSGIGIIQELRAKQTLDKLALGIVAAGLIEVIWWVQGAVVGERRRLWREPAD